VTQNCLFSFEIQIFVAFSFGKIPRIKFGKNNFYIEKIFFLKKIFNDFFFKREIKKIFGST